MAPWERTHGAPVTGRGTGDGPVSFGGGAGPPVALTVAGSDSASGAGLQADLKAMSALGVFATTAVTLVTAQNTAEVRGVLAVPPEMVDAQISAVLDDLAVAAVKTGLLGSAGVVDVVARRAAAGELPRLVVDPVLVASDGRPIVDGAGVAATRDRLLPHALLATPNLAEAAILAGVDRADLVDVPAMVEAARRIHDLGPAWVLVKGGGLPGVGVGVGVGVGSAGPGGAPEVVTDVLFDGAEATVLTSPRVDTANTHGTGCSLSAAVAAHLARGDDLPAAVSAARSFVHRALRNGSTWRLGHGHGPLDPFGWSAPGR